MSGSGMVNVGDQMENVRSGERFLWRATRQSTGGEHCEFDLYLTATAKTPAPHRHPSQVEQFTVLDGNLNFRLNRHRSTVATGQAVTVPANSTHFWGTTGGQPAHVRVRLTPALHIEDYFAAYCAIATAGQAGSVGLPRNIFQLAVLLNGYRAEFDFAYRWQQILLKPLLAAVAAWGRRRGFRTTYPPGR